MIQTHIDRKQWVERHDPRFDAIDTESPISLGNGNFAFTADITGLQTLYSDYTSPPLCTMSDWGWHTTPDPVHGSYLLDDLTMTRYSCGGREVSYPTDTVPGDEVCYEWLRKNPHRLNLMRLGLSWGDDEIDASRIGEIDQRLHMYDGCSDSRFTLDGVSCRVQACVDALHDTLALRICSDALKGALRLRMAFPYADYHIAGSNWDVPDRHSTKVLRSDEHALVLKRRLDRDVYYVHICSIRPVSWELDPGSHAVMIRAEDQELELTIHLSPGLQALDNADIFCDPKAIFSRTAALWHDFWEKGGAVQLIKSADPRAAEIERRIVQSLYIQAVPATGSLPPQETGLLCNSWYGKPHGEMFLWHCAFLPLWNHADLLEKKLQWHMRILPAARENAARNGYAGARWPKMADPFTGFDGPSWISPLLIWQQPHLIFILMLFASAVGNNPAMLEPYWPLVKESADFMASFPVRNPDTGKYELLEPLLPADEVGEPLEVRNPSFELAYWKFGLQLAIKYAALVSKPVPPLWRAVEANMQPPLACPDGYIHYEISPAYRDKKTPDHVIPIAICGLLPGWDIDRALFRRQYTDHLARDGHTMDFGGWFRGYHAMTETRLQMPEVAIDSLLTTATGDSFVKAGYNCLGHEGVGTGMQNLPVYMPGNGALLLAMPLMAVGYPGSKRAPGFPENGQWVVETENLNRFPF